MGDQFAGKKRGAGERTAVENDRVYGVIAATRIEGAGRREGAVSRPRLPTSMYRHPWTVEATALSRVEARNIVREWAQHRFGPEREFQGPLRPGDFRCLHPPDGVSVRTRASLFFQPDAKSVADDASGERGTWRWLRPQTRKPEVSQKI